ncbi:MAG: hypothetical protein ACRD5H_09525 [Nitrososphaerales archaeon]
MTVWFPVCSRGAVLACSVVGSLVLSGGVPQFLQAEGKGNQVQHCFDFSTVHQKYKSEEDAERALQHCYPIGSDATELITYLAAVADQTSEQIKGFDSLNSNEPVTGLSFTKVIDVGEGNKTEWGVLLVLNMKSEVLLSQVRLGYRGPNFHLRGIPYRLCQLSDPPEVIKATLLKLLSPDVTTEKVDAFMTEAGTIKVNTREDFKIQPSQKEMYRNIQYLCVRRERDKFMARYFGLPPVGTYVNWIFNSKGRFIDVYVNMDPVYD